MAWLSKTEPSGAVCWRDRVTLAVIQTRCTKCNWTSGVLQQGGQSVVHLNCAISSKAICGLRLRRSSGSSLALLGGNSLGGPTLMMARIWTGHPLLKKAVCYLLAVLGGGGSSRPLYRQLSIEWRVFRSAWFANFGLTSRTVAIPLFCVVVAAWNW